MCPWSSSPNVAGTYYLLRTGETSYPSYFFCIYYNVLEHWLRDSDQIFRRTERVSIRLARVNVGSVLFVRVRVRLLGLFYLLALSRVFSILLAKYLYYSFFLLLSCGYFWAYYLSLLTFCFVVICKKTKYMKWRKSWILYRAGIN